MPRRWLCQSNPAPGNPLRVAAGLLHDRSPRPPIMLLNDMDNQPKLLPQSESHFFADGASGTGDEDVLAGAENGDEDCRLALSVFNHRLRREIAAMTAAIGGLDL